MVAEASDVVYEEEDINQVLGLQGCLCCTPDLLIPREYHIEVERRDDDE